MPLIDGTPYLYTPPADLETLPANPDARFYGDVANDAVALHALCPQGCCEYGSVFADVFLVSTNDQRILSTQITV